MVGKPSLLSFDNLKSSQLEALEFLFNFEEIQTESFNTSQSLPQDVPTFFISGNIEFNLSKKNRFWSYVASIVALSALSSFVYYIQTQFPQPEKAVVASIGLLDVPQKSEHIIPEKTSKIIPVVEEIPVAKEEKVVKTPQSIAPKAAKLEKTQIKKKPLKGAVKQKTMHELSVLPTAPKNRVEHSNRLNNFKTISLSEARELSAETGRYTFIKFGADWCITCKLMEETALTDKRIVNILDSKFVVLDVDIDQASGSRIKDEFYINQLPTLIILDDLGNQVRRQEGAIGTTDLFNMLELAAQNINLIDAVTVQHTSFGKQNQGGK